MRAKSKTRAEFGDFQTPEALARDICASLRIAPRAVVEPTCGTGSFIAAALSAFPTLRRAAGHDVNADYLRQAAAKLTAAKRKRAEFVRQSFFETDWRELFAALPEPLLVLGNPPWVTNAELGVLGSGNLPQKNNFQKHRGLDALTGKSNFDISEWMLIRLIEALQGREAELAMLCKTSVARKVLAHAWKNELCIERAAMFAIDAKKHFGVAVDACLLRAGPFAKRETRARVFSSLQSVAPVATIGLCDGTLVADVNAYEKWHMALNARDSGNTWRSGIKHDCARVMEFTRENGRYVNGLGEAVVLEDAYLFPLLKSSDLARGRAGSPRRFLLVPQRSVGEDTARIKKAAPKTWAYLQRHAAALQRRGSSIYRKRPPFSIFGVGPYTFAPWKVAISGLYKTLRFSVVGSFCGKPVVLDDTCYFLACKSHAKAAALAERLNSPQAAEALGALIFWDSKRPITAEVLRRVDVEALHTATMNDERRKANDE